MKAQHKQFLKEQRHANRLRAKEERQAQRQEQKQQQQQQQQQAEGVQKKKKNKKKTKKDSAAVAESLSPNKKKEDKKKLKARDPAAVVGKGATADVGGGSAKARRTASRAPPASIRSLLFTQDEVGGWVAGHLLTGLTSACASECLRE